MSTNVEASEPPAQVVVVTLRQAGLFYLFAFGLSVACAALIARGGPEATVVVFMFTPLLAVLLTEAITRPRGRWRALPCLLAMDRAGWRRWPFALLAPPVVVGLVTLAVVAAGAARLVAPETPMRLPASIAVSLAIGAVWSFGEEAGWRGYLLPGLLGLGLWPAMLLCGLLHGIWHLPLALLTPVYLGDGAPWIVLPGFVVVLTLAGVAYGYARLTSASLWPAVLLHASFNESLARGQSLAVTLDPARRAHLGGESGLFTILVMLGVVAVLAWRWPKPAAPRLGAAGPASLKPRRRQRGR